jgi:hypothetical protein
MNSRTILAVSILINIGLVGAVTHLITSRPAPPEPAVISEAEHQETRSETEPRSIKPAAKSNPGAIQLWRNIESPDYKTYIANLRAIGCPEETIRDIIKADVNKLYAARQQALNSPPVSKEFKFWQKDPTSSDNTDWEKKNKERQALSKEQQALLNELLGPESPKEPGKTQPGQNYYDTRYAFLPEEKRRQIQEVQQKYSEMEQQIYRNAREVMLPEDEVELKRIRDARKADLAQVLTPQELEDYNLRDAPTANQMRHELGDFNPSEAEFRAIFRIRQGFDEEYNRAPDPDDKDFWKRREADQRKIDDQIKAVLGDQRFAEYQMSKDSDYQNLSRIAKRFEVPQENVVALYNLKKSVEDQANQIRLDAKMPNQQRQEDLANLRAAAERTIIQTLGDNGYRAYRRQGAYWIQNIR